MKSSRIISLIAVIVLTFGTAAFAAKTTAKGRLHAHGLGARGAIVSVDEKARTMEVKETNGKTVDFVWTEATHLTKAPLTVGERVNVRYMKKDGKNIATVITAPKGMSHKAVAKTSQAAPAKAAPAKSVTTSSSTVKSSTAKATPAKSSATKSSPAKAPAPKKG